MVCLHREHLQNVLTVRHADDSEQTTYLLYASDNNQNFKISRMDSNYYNVVQQVSVIPSASLGATRLDLLLTISRAQDQLSSLLGL